MAQIHALTPEGRLPSAAVAHVQEITVPPTWEDLSGKPTSFPSTIPEVTGLQAIIDQLTYDSGWRDISGLLTSGWSGSVYVRRLGSLVEVLIGGIIRGADAGLTAFILPSGFRPFARGATAPRPLLTTATNPPIIDRAYVPGGQFQVLSNESASLPLYGSFTFTDSTPPPATPPGDPT